MIIDRYNRYSKDQAITASGATVSESVVDLGADGDAIGHERYLHILCKEAVAGTLTTVQFSLYTDDDEAFGSPVLLWQSAAIAKATLIAGYIVAKLRVPMGMLQYTRLTYTTDNTATAGEFSSWLGDAGDANDFTQ